MALSVNPVPCRIVRVCVCVCACVCVCVCARVPTGGPPPTESKTFQASLCPDITLVIPRPDQALFTTQIRQSPFDYSN